MNVQEWLGVTNVIGCDIYERKYRFQNETLDGFFDRVSGGDKALRQLMLEKKFLLGGRVLSNRNTDGTGSYFNCYSSGNCPDDLKGIMQLNTNLALTYKAQGGQGLSLSKVRPKGTPIGKRFESDGIIPFLEMFNQTTATISQGSSRKGALMVSLDIRHKEAEDFIKIKAGENKINKANLSLEIDDTFMKAVEDYYTNGKTITLHEVREYNGHKIEYDITPINLYKQLVQTCYDWADPACLFTDRFRNYNLMEFDNDYEIVTSNPCFTGDMRILTAEGYKTFEELDGQEVSLVTKDGDYSDGKVWCSGEKPVISLYLINGGIIRCTPDHIFMLANNAECKAMDLLGEQIKTFDGVMETVTDIVYSFGTEKVYDFSEPFTHWGVVEGCIVHNCGEQPLPKDFCCNLGSLNLSEFVKESYTEDAWFDYEEFKNAIEIAVKALDDIIDENAPNHALPQQSKNSLNYRNIGLGVMGYANCLMKRGLKYGTKEANKFTDDLFRFLFKTAVKASSQLAKEKGAFPKYKDIIFNSTIIEKHFNRKEIEDLRTYGIRNCSLISIAPTGTIATMLGISGGCEPEFAIKYKRKTESLNKGETKYYDVYCNSLIEYQNFTGNDDIPSYFVSSADIDWKDRVEVQAIMQNHVDTAISSTVNLPQDTPLESVENLYLHAWQKGLKGITIYRNGCKREGILTTDTKSSTPTTYIESDTNNLVWGTVLQLSDDLIGRKRKIMSGCGAIHVQAYFDDVTGKMMEVYLAKGSQGGCNSFLTGTSRMISLALRSGTPLETVTDQLKSTPSCPSYAVRAATKKDTSCGNCCPTALANALADMQKQVFDELGIEDSSEQPSHVISKAMQSIIKSTCPECQEELVFEGGCNSCKNCGYSKCS